MYCGMHWTRKMLICADFITCYFFHRHRRAKLPRNTDLSGRDVLIQISVANTLTPHSYGVKIVSLTLCGAFFSHWGIFIIQNLYPIGRGIDFKGGYLSSYRFTLSLKNIYITLSSSGVLCRGWQRSGDAVFWQWHSSLWAQKRRDYGYVKHLIKFLYLNCTRTKEHLLLRGG